ncbi:hypothetical protein ACMFMG_002772 [Clarireedia jacksonii]
MLENMKPGGLIVPPGNSAPFAVVTDTDHSAWIIIATSLGLACVLVFGAIRTFVKTSSWNIGSFSYDGFCLAASTLLASIQACVILGACAKGLGKSIELVPPKNITSIQQLIIPRQMYYTSTVLFMLSLGLSKISVVFLLLSLTPHEQHRKIFLGVIGLLVTWTVASTFAIALQCNLAHPWLSIGEQCPGAFERWQIISALDIIFELATVGMTIYLVWSLRTSRSNKIIVICAFASRLPMIIAIGFRLANFDVVGLTTNPTLLEGAFIVWTQTELNYSIISAIIPSLRPFIKNLSTNYGQELGGRAGYGTGLEESSANYQLSNLGSVAGRGSRGLDARHRENPDDYKYEMWANQKDEAVREAYKDSDGSSSAIRIPALSEGNITDRVSLGSSDSRQMIIKKDVTWRVEHDTT